MSGHSKWHSIKHKKGALDAKRGKIFTKHAKLITIAAKDGADPEMNPSLRTAISNAKSDNVPNANIEKAIKKGAGGGKDGVRFDEIMYEGFGPAGVAVYVQAITDNRNRSVASVKTCFMKNCGTMGEAGSVGWMFDHKGLIIVKVGVKDPDEAEMEIIEAGAEDLELFEETFEITTAFTDLMKVRDKLEEAGFEVAKAEPNFIAKNEVKIETLEDAQKLYRLIEALEDDDDVGNVYTSADVPDEIMEQL